MVIKINNLLPEKKRDFLVENLKNNGKSVKTLKAPLHTISIIDFD